MQINKTGFITALKLRSSGDRGWLTGICPFCNSKDKLGVLLEGDGDRKPHFHCFKASCGKSGSLVFLARSIKRPELVSSEYVAPMDIGMSIEEVDEIMTVSKCRIPLGFKRCLGGNQYLDKRGITDYQYSLYKFGVSTIDPKIGKDYVILLIEEDGVCVGYVSRSIKSKEYIDEFNKNNPDIQFPRYKNSESDFSKLIFGLDEIVVGSTDTMIIVEGGYSKLAVDRKLNLYENDNIKCGSSFGAKLSDIQAAKIAMKGVKNIIILYDSGVVNISKKVSRIASSYFHTVRIGSLTNGDPDEVSVEELKNAVDTAKSIFEYSVSELQDFEL